MLHSYFFNSINGDRRYKAEHWAAYFASFISNGVFPLPADGLMVKANGGMVLAVGAGRLFINGYIAWNDSEYYLTVHNADGALPRIDRVVARWSMQGREITLAVKKGTYAANPVAPALQRDADAWELGLCDVTVKNGAIEITQSAIKDLRLNNAYCGLSHAIIEQLDTSTYYAQIQAALDEFKKESIAAYLEAAEYLEAIKLFQYEQKTFRDEAEQFYISTVNLAAEVRAFITDFLRNPFNLRDPTTGEMNDLQSILYNLYNSMSRQDALTVEEFAALGLTVEEFAAAGLTVEEFALQGKILLGKG